MVTPLSGRGEAPYTPRKVSACRHSVFLVFMVTHEMGGNARRSAGLPQGNPPGPVSRSRQSCSEGGANVTLVETAANALLKQL